MLFGLTSLCYAGSRRTLENTDGTELGTDANPLYVTAQ